MLKELGGGFKREGIWVYLWLIQADVWQKSTQFCKAVTLQLNINKFIKKKKIYIISVDEACIFELNMEGM